MLALLYIAGFIAAYLTLAGMSDWEPSGVTGNQTDDIASFIFVFGALLWPLSLPIALYVLARRRRAHASLSV